MIKKKEQTELLTAQIIRLKVENSSSRLVSLAERQLERTKEKLRKEKISEEKLEAICQLQGELVKLKIELGIEEETEEYEARQETPHTENKNRHNKKTIAESWRKGNFRGRKAKCIFFPW